MENNISSNINIHILCSLSNSHPVSSQYFQGMVYILYGIIFIVSIIGNGIVCYIVVSYHGMKSVTNYFITNLAIGDILITLFCVPFTSISYLKQYWPFGDFLCPVVNYAQAISVFVSTYTMVAISLDRYAVILWPLKPKLNKKLAFHIICAVWIMAAITALPILLLSKLSQPEVWYELCDRFLCKEDWSNLGIEYEFAYTVVLLLLQYLIPLIVLVFSYISMGIVIWCHQIPGEAESYRDQRNAKSKHKLVKMMVTVVSVFTLCWLPINLLWLSAENIPEDFKPYLWFSSHWFAMSHACYNPIIYCYMNSRFRAGFLHVGRKIPWCKHRTATNVSMLYQWSTGIPLNSMERTGSISLQQNNPTTMTHLVDTNSCKH